MHRGQAWGAFATYAADVNSVFVAVETFKTRFEHLERVARDKQATVEADIPLFNPSPSDIICAGEAIESNISADCCNLFSHFIALLACPKIEVQHDIKAKFQASRPNRPICSDTLR